MGGSARLAVLSSGWQSLLLMAASATVTSPVAREAGSRARVLASNGAEGSREQLFFRRVVVSVHKKTLHRLLLTALERN